MGPGNMLAHLGPHSMVLGLGSSWESLAWGSDFIEVVGGAVGFPKPLFIGEFKTEEQDSEA